MWQADPMDNQPFTPKPSLFVMIPLIALILGLGGVAAWHHAGALQVGGVALAALGLAVLAIALRRRA